MIPTAGTAVPYSLEFDVPIWKESPHGMTTSPIEQRRMTSSIQSRSARAWVQLGVSSLGLLVILGSLVVFAILFGSMPRSESGFAEGLAIVLFGLYVLVGFVVLAAGLLIPQSDASGIQFSSRQRTLLIYGALAPIVSVISIPNVSMFAPPISPTVTTVLVISLAVFLVSGPLATLLVLGLKLRERWI